MTNNDLTPAAQPQPNAIATSSQKRVSLTEMMAQQMNLDPANLLRILKTQIITVPQGAAEATNEEMAVVLSVMKELKLSPMVREIHAWRDNRGKLCVMVGYDGWVKFARRNPDYSHVSYKYSEKMVTPDKGKPCPEWIAPSLHKTNGDVIDFPPVPLAEWYVAPRGSFSGPWQNQTSNRLRQKAFTIIIREIYGMSLLDEIDGENIRIYDEDERDRVRAETAATLDKDADAMHQRVRAMKPATAPAEAVYEEVTEKAGTTEPPAATEGTPEPPAEEPDGPQDDDTEDGRFDNDIDCSTSFCGQPSTFICSDCRTPHCDRHRWAGTDKCTMCGLKK